ncbi:MAG TPA: hypothetical protein VJS68_00965 [Thermoplasmata archaeon]|nr:hypothetical protein [Thermoplasmata archaeon]
MRSDLAARPPPSLLGITVRRSVTLGRIYLGFGGGYLVLLGVITANVSPAAFQLLLPLLLPTFAVLGSIGGLMVFTNDRVKGVYEYLISYGVSPRRLFSNVLASTLILASIVIGVSLPVGLGVYVVRGNPVSLNLLESLGAYSLPMSYASTAFAATVGMFWTSLSSPRQGMNSPVGLVPLIGVAPGILTLVAVEAVRGVSTLDIAGIAVALVVGFVLLLLLFMERLMPLERLLSPV